MKPNLSEGTLIPCRNRDYTDDFEVIRDFKAGKDFNLITPIKVCLCSICDAKPQETITFRYDKGTKQVTFTLF